MYQPPPELREIGVLELDEEGIASATRNTRVQATRAG